MEIENNLEKLNLISSAAGSLEENESWEVFCNSWGFGWWRRTHFPLSGEEERQIRSQKWIGCEWMGSEGIGIHVSSISIKEEGMVRLYY